MGAIYNYIHITLVWCIHYPCHYINWKKNCNCIKWIDYMTNIRVLLAKFVYFTFNGFLIKIYVARYLVIYSAHLICWWFRSPPLLYLFTFIEQQNLTVFTGLWHHVGNIFVYRLTKQMKFFFKCVFLICQVDRPLF